MRSPLVRVQRIVRESRKALASCAAKTPELEAELRRAVAAVTLAEHRCAELLGEAPSARERREAT